MPINVRASFYSNMLSAGWVCMKIVEDAGVEREKKLRDVELSLIRGVNSAPIQHTLTRFQKLTMQH